MLTLRLRYENGHLIPLDPEPLATLHEGEEIQVMWQSAEAPATPDNSLDWVERTRGIWADFPEIEDYIAQSRQVWDEEWKSRLNEL